jgi:hypothetical protein
MFQLTKPYKPSEISSIMRSHWQVKAIMELLEVCLRTTYFQMDDKFFQQEDGTAMGSSLSTIVSNIFIEHFEKLPLDSAQHKPSLWLQYVDDTFVVWSHGPSWLQDLLSHLTHLRPSIQFTMKTESDSVTAFLDVLVIREEITLATKVYRKPHLHWLIPQLQLYHPSRVKKRFDLESSQQSFHYMPSMTRSG